MTRVPTIDGDDNNWGDVLNAFLAVGHNSDGSLHGVAPVYNIQTDFGAVGNGSTDDTARVQAAIDAASSLTSGGTVVIPHTTGGFAVTQVLLKDRVNLVGVGWRSVLTSIAGNTADALIKLSSTGVNYTRCANFRINGNKANKGVGATTVGVSIQGGTGNPEHEITRLFIQNMAGRGIETLPGAIGTRVYDNWIYQVDGEGIYIGAGDTIVDRNITGNTGLEGIYIAAFNVKTSNNKPFFAGQVNAARGTGIKVSSIADNYMSVNDEPQDNLGDGWLIDSCKNAIIMGGDPNNNAGAAVKINGGSYHRLAYHVGGGERTQSTAAIAFTGSPTNIFADVTYHPNGALAGSSGTIPASPSSVRINGLLAGTVAFTTNAGSPEGVVTANLGSYCADTTNGEGYIKKTGSGNTGWKLITHA